jgi:hypothetical protein
MYLNVFFQSTNKDSANKYFGTHVFEMSLFVFSSFTWAVISSLLETIIVTNHRIEMQRCRILSV